MSRKPCPTYDPDRHSNPPYSSVAASRLFGLLTGVVLVIAVARNIQPPSIALASWKLPTLFGLCLAGLVGGVFLRTRGGEASTRRARIRQSSRIVYLWLYALLGVNEAAAYMSHSSVEAASAKLGGFLIAGLLVLTLIRLLDVAQEPLLRGFASMRSRADLAAVFKMGDL